MSDVDFAEVFAAIAAPVTVMDRELRYVAANPAYLELMGVRWTDLASRSMLEVFPARPRAP